MFSQWFIERWLVLVIECHTLYMSNSFLTIDRYSLHVFLISCLQMFFVFSGPPCVSFWGGVRLALHTASSRRDEGGQCGQTPR